MAQSSFDLHDENHPANEDEDEGADSPASWTRKRLEPVFSFTNAHRVTIILSGGGLLDGSDHSTHQTIKDIARSVRRLIDQFGGRFDIKKRLTRQPYPSKSLRSYWDPPTDAARRSVRKGNATFEQIVQIEMEEWTAEFPSTVGPWMNREIPVLLT